MNQEVVESAFELELTTEQKLVLSQSEAFVVNQEADVLIITGAAGTGKSVIIGELCKRLYAQHKTVLIAAPTGSASYNLHKRTGLQVSTLHSQLYHYSGIKEKGDDYYTLEFDLNTNLVRPDCIIMDEAGMIGDKEQSEGILRFGSGRVLNDLIQLGKKFSTPPKLIFVGDPYQLAPINQQQSPCLFNEYLEYEYQLRVHLLELTEIKRQTDRFLLSTLHYLREKIAHQDESAFQLTDESPKGIASLEVADVYVKENPLRKPFQSAIIAYTNAKVSEYNHLVREKYGFNDTLHEGDLLLSTRTIYDEAREVLTNGSIIQVERVSSMVESRTIPIRVKDKGEILIELRFRTAEIRPVDSSDESVKQVKILENSLTAETSSIGEEVWRALFVDFLVRHKGLLEQKKQARGIPEEYSKWLKKFAEELRKDPYFNAVLVKYAYAITGHRSQGHEWETVYVDVDSQKNIHSIDGLKWLYTACTRAKEKLVFINKEKTNFFALCEFQGFDELSNIPAGFYATKHIKVEADDDPSIHQFPFIKPFIATLKAVEYRLNAVLDITYGSYFIRTNWTIGSKMIPIDFGYSKKGMKELVVKMDLFERSTVYRDLIREIQTAKDVLDIPKAKDTVEQFMREKLLHALDLYQTRLCNVVEKSEYQTDYHLENAEGKAVLSFWRNKQLQYSSVKMKSEAAATGDIYPKLIDYLLMQ